MEKPVIDKTKITRVGGDAEKKGTHALLAGCELAATVETVRSFLEWGYCMTHMTLLSVYTKN